MSENIKEAASEAVEAAKQSIINRFSGAFTAYVITTWLALNWSDLAILFMSSVTVERRIQAIYSQDFLWINHLILPVIIGFILSIVIPFINSIVISFTSYFSARSDSSQRRAKLKVETELEAKRQKKLSITANIDTLKSEYNYLLNNISMLESKRNSLIDATVANYNDILRIALRIDKLSKDLSPINEVIQYSPEQLVKQINNIITPKERANAIQWRNDIINNLGIEAANSLFEEKPEILTIDKELVYELLRFLKKNED